MKNRTYIAAKTIVWAFVIGALVVSYTHIVHLFGMLGLHGWQAWAAPAFVDGFAMLGLLGRSHSFAPETRKIGLRIQVAATLISLVANITAGESCGARIFGAMVVAGYVVAEWYADKLRPIEAAHADDAKAKRSAAAKKAAATRKANATKPATRGRKPLTAVA